ncbi:MFS transporter [Falsiroseomonas sp.]|uniref:MFS transporter n=1 Tax=Falsiroseomonas sp. TaxID=2870721 RepID=UPI003569E885
MDRRQGRGVLAVPDFRRLWVVGLALSVARWLEMLVIGVIAFQQTGSAFVVAAMTLLRLLPLGLFGALLGVLADRAPRRLTLLAVLALQAAAAGALSAFAFAGALTVWQMAVASFLSGAGWATDNPVRRMMVGEAVGTARMGAAMSLDVMASNASRVAGPALGGTLLATLGAGTAFGLAALLQLAAIGAAARVRCGATAAAPAQHEPVLRQLRESFALALHLPKLRGVLVVTVVFNLFGWPCTSMIPVIGQQPLGLGPEGVGVLASMEGLGALLGAGLVGMLASPARYAAVYVGGTALYLAMCILFALAPHPVPAGLALLTVGIGGAGFATMQATLVYLTTPPEIRGRALGLLATAIGTGLLGFLQLGLLAEWLGAPEATALVAAQGLTALLATRRLWRPLL